MNELHDDAVASTLSTSGSMPRRFDLVFDRWLDHGLDGLLIAGVIVLTGVLISAWPQHEPVAHADSAVRSNDFGMVTTKSGPDEVLAVLDDRAEMLLIYEVRNQNELRLSGRERLDRLFDASRGQRPAR